jgi:hypothetical protein
MKRFLGLVSLFLLFNSCDDGDLTLETIDFSNATAQKCGTNNIIYKIKNTEALLLLIPSTTFVNDETASGAPIELSINNTNQVVYRQYNGTLSTDNICPVIPAATPNVIEEWIATSGTIQITTTAIKTTNNVTNATKITGYKHYIVFKNVTFQKPNGVQIYETFVFGNYNTSITPLTLGFGQEAQKSTCDNRIFNISGGESLIVDANAALFENIVTTTPRTATINATNKVTYRLHNGIVDNNFFCSSPAPLIPTLNQEWNAVEGTENINGIIEVSTTTFGTGFQHNIRLKKVSLKRGNSTFYLGDDYLYGSFYTN